MPKKVYLVRHGESGYGAKGIYQTYDTPLSPAGIKQAEVLARRFSTIPIDVIYASPLPRARQTADIINASLVQNLDALREIKRPSEIIGKPLADGPSLAIKRQLIVHVNDPTWHYSDEENFYEVRDRSLELLKLLEEDEAQNILLVSHAMILRVLFMVMAFGRNAGHEIHQNLYSHFRMTQTGITLLEHNGRGWLLMTWNDYAHLGDDTTESFYKRLDI